MMNQASGEQASVVMKLMVMVAGIIGLLSSYRCQCSNRNRCGSVDPPKDSWLESPGYFLGTQEQWYESEPHNSQERHPTWYQKMG